MKKILIFFLGFSLAFGNLLGQTGDTLLTATVNGSDTTSLDILTKIIDEVTIKKEGREYYRNNQHLNKGFFGKQLAQELSTVPDAAAYADKYVRLYKRGSAWVAIGIAGVFVITLNPAISTAAVLIMLVPEGLGFVDLTRKGSYLTKSLIIYNRAKILQRVGTM